MAGRGFEGYTLLYVLAARVCTQNGCKSSMSTLLLPQHKICTNTARNDRVKEEVFVHPFMIKSLKFPWKLGMAENIEKKGKSLCKVPANSHPPYLIVISFLPARSMSKLGSLTPTLLNERLQSYNSTHFISSTPL